jgi:DNA polymerase epsilon subunit 2
MSRMRNKVPKVHFATNPCRIKFFEQEIVVFREDTMARMLRNTIRVKQEAESEDLRRYVRPEFLALLFCYTYGVGSWYRQF